MAEHTLDRSTNYLPEISLNRQSSLILLPVGSPVVIRVPASANGSCAESLRENIILDSYNLRTGTLGQYSDGQIGDLQNLRVSGSLEKCSHYTLGGQLKMRNSKGKVFSFLAVQFYKLPSERPALRRITDATP